MKRIQSGLIALISLYFIACTSGGDKYSLSPRLTKGNSFTIATNSSTNFTMDIMGNPQEYKMNNESEARYEVLDSTTEGAEIKMTFLKQQNKMDFGKLVPDSTNRIGSDSASQAMIGKSIYFKVKDRKISGVRGFEEINRREDSIVAMMMKKFMPEETFEQMSNLLFDVYPAKAVGVGDSWKKNTSISFAGIPIQLNTKYILRDVKDNLAAITVEGKIHSKGGELPMMPGLKMDLDGKYKGAIKLNINTGYLHTSSYDAEVKTEPEVMGEKIPMLIKTSVTATGK